MSKLHLLLLALFHFSAPPAIAGGPYLPKGHWIGSEFCKTEKGLGKTHPISLNLKEWSLELDTTSDFIGNAAGKKSLEFQDKGFGIFIVKDKKENTGFGYCGGDCHLDLTNGNGREHLTLSFSDEHKRRLKISRAILSDVLHTIEICQSELNKRGSKSSDE